MAKNRGEQGRFSSVYVLIGGGSCIPKRLAAEAQRRGGPSSKSRIIAGNVFRRAQRASKLRKGATFGETRSLSPRLCASAVNLHGRAAARRRKVRTPFGLHNVKEPRETSGYPRRHESRTRRRLGHRERFGNTRPYLAVCRSNVAVLRCVLERHAVDPGFDRRTALVNDVNHDTAPGRVVGAPGSLLMLIDTRQCGPA